MHARARAFTLSEVSQWCETTGHEPTTVVGLLLAGQQLADISSLLGVRSVKSEEDALQIA